MSISYIIPSATSYDLSGQFINNALLADLIDNENLTHLKLNRCKGITDTSLEIIGKMKNLEILDLSRCRQFTGTGLKHIAPLKKLTTLNLAGTRIQDRHLTPLTTHKNLTDLNLECTSRITGKALEHIGKIENLRKLSLAHTGNHIEESALVHLENLKHLNYLDLDSCHYSDTSLPFITVAPQLTTLILKNNSGFAGPITENGIKNRLYHNDKTRTAERVEIENHLNELDVLNDHRDNKDFYNIYSIIVDYLPLEKEVIYQEYNPDIVV